MMVRLRTVCVSFVIAVAVVSLVVLVSRIPSFESLDLLLAPGMLISVLIFPDGIHSGHANAFLLLAALADATLLTLPIHWLKGRIWREK
jgi:hypothetical protein